MQEGNSATNWMMTYSNRSQSPHHNCLSSRRKWFGGEAELKHYSSTESLYQWPWWLVWLPRFHCLLIQRCTTSFKSDITPYVEFYCLLEIVYNTFSCTQSGVLPYIGWHLTLHVILLFAGNCLKHIFMYSKWHVTPCRTTSHLTWNFTVCWKLSEMHVYAGKVVCYPTRDDISLCMEFNFILLFWLEIVWNTFLCTQRHVMDLLAHSGMNFPYHGFVVLLKLIDVPLVLLLCLCVHISEMYYGQWFYWKWFY